MSWDEVARGWCRYGAPVALPAQRAIMAVAGVGPGTRVLDVGCGSGEFVAVLLEAGAQVAACDPASGMVELAQGMNPGADIRIASAEQLPWPDESFDLVAAVNVLAFAEHPLAEFARATT